MLYLIRYGEIALKGKNRYFFENTLLKNIKRALGDLEVKVTREHTRVYTRVIHPEDAEEVRKRLQKVIGVVSLSPVRTAPLSLEEIQKRALQLIKEEVAGHHFTFKVETRRPNKNFPHTSPEINREVGAFILKNTEGASVDVHNPGTELFVEIREKEAYLYLDSYAGPGGLPVGVSGKGLLLLSGGIDSPVAGWLTMKRGLEIDAVHYHSYPFTSERAKEKVKKLVEVLSDYHPSIKLHVLPFTETQKEIQAKCPRELSITIMRRMMFRMAQALTYHLKAKVLITGESLGQVASQTIENITAAAEVVDLPVFRPLIGLDKLEISHISQRIGTYPISIQPYEDCCTVFLPDHPVTRPKLERVVSAEQDLDIDRLVKESLQDYETFTF